MGGCIQYSASVFAKCSVLINASCSTSRQGEISFFKAHYQLQIITMSATIYETPCSRHLAKCFTSTISPQSAPVHSAATTLASFLFLEHLSSCPRAFALTFLGAWNSSFRYPNGSLPHLLQVSAQMSHSPTTSIKVLLPYLVHMPLPPDTLGILLPTPPPFVV